MTSLLETLRRARCRRQLEQVNKLEPQMKALGDEEIAERVLALRQRRRRGAELTDLLPQMYALVREASRRAIGVRQYDIQVEAAVSMANGCVIEMNTGEGKTFVAPMAAALYALDQRGVHVLTANDYLAGRDTRVLKPVYELLGLTADVVLADSGPRERARAFEADVTYSTVHQLGFGFLRQYFQQAPEALRQQDMWRYIRSEIDGSNREKRCLRGRYFAILDEVDSILIDYARSPLSISVQAETQRPPEVYTVARRFAVESLQQKTDYKLDLVRRNVELTDRGKKRVGELQKEYGYLHLMDAEWEERLEEALSAEHLFNRGEHYVVQGGLVVLVDQTSGRLMIGQRLGAELHLALEHKEGVPIQPRQTVAKKITIQSLIRPYERLAGMTGTAWEERKEFRTVYGMRILRFEPRLRLRRQERPDRFSTGADARWEAVVEDILAEHARGRPVLVGTRSIDKSEALSQMLKDRKVDHQVLSGVNHAREAEIIAEAGQRGAVTVAARMAGRGVEIKLGDGVEELGGMHVVSTERDILSRVDRQLAGRCGRRGSPGSVQYFVSTDDDVFQVLSERRRKRVKRDCERLGSGPRNSDSLSRTVQTAQEMFAHRFSQIRQALLVRDLAQEETQRILFGQDRL